MRGKVRVFWWVFVGLGIAMGAFWGLPPAGLLQNGLPSLEGNPEKGALVFVLIATFYGYLSFILVFIWLVFAGFLGPLSRSIRAKKILKSRFGNGERRIGIDTFRKLTGLTGEEMRRLFEDRDSGFGLDDYRRAGAYLKGLGIRIENRLQSVDPGAGEAPGN